MPMSGLNIFTSNRLEILAEYLSRMVKRPASSVLAAETIVIQSRGMERWVSLELARHNGICANIRFPFPNAFLQEIAEQVLPEFSEPSTFEPEILMFKIMKILPHFTELNGFEHLKAYLADDATYLKRMQLSNKLADIFDQYQVFRPEMILGWEKGAEGAHSTEQWQAQIWRQLVKDGQNLHRAGLQRELIKKITGEPHQFSCLPERIFIFGISYLPLFHLQTFVALGQLAEINFFILNPCREYWGDIVSEKQMQTFKKQYSRSADLTTALHLEQGNRLLAAMGAHGRNFFTLIDSFDFQRHEIYDDPGCTSLLGCIQSDILNLRERKGITAAVNNQTNPLARPAPPICVDASDISIQVHCCHSPMREIEVLHDNLLAMFDQDPQLLPKDIIVMTPDIEVYAPYIQAVFETQIDEGQRIPFRVADQSIREQSRLIDDFLSLLDLKGSRLSAAQMMRLLESPGVKQKFGLDDSDIETVERWIRDTRIRWGVDDQSRQQLGLPATSDNTWRAGIERLLLGYAMPGNNQRMFAGILPYDNIEGNEVHSFGKFLHFVDKIFCCAKELERPKQLKRWSAEFKGLLDDFFAVNEETEREAQILQTIFEDLGNRQTDAEFDEALEFEPVRFYLVQRLAELRRSSDFMTGGVTFCAMLPMRSIPFKVICLIGMNSDRFPRDDQFLTFDLIANHQRPGDRSRRNDDKYLFLESIISAREKLYISYVGQSILDNSRIPPSVVVSELLDAIDQGFYLTDKNIREHVVSIHRLQAFSAQYFKKDAELFSYSRENRDAAASLNTRKEPAPLITGAIPLTPPELEQVHRPQIETLCRFFACPTRFLLQQRLGIYLEETLVLTDQSEDFSLTPLDRYRVGQNMVRSGLAGKTPDDYRPLQMAMGQLPHGAVGAYYYNEMSIDAEWFVRKIESLRDEKISDSLETQIKIDEFYLQVRFPEIYRQGLIQIRYANQRAQDLLESWIYHLALCAVAPDNWPLTSILLLKNATWQFSPVAENLKYLSDLLNIFKQGLEEPLHFFPNTSLQYVRQQQIKGRKKSAALASARKEWVSSEFTRGESDNPYYDLGFKMTDPLDESFEEISQTVFEPLLAHAREIQNN
jgi:exodeoxyribonuclease V gamma subunit